MTYFIQGGKIYKIVRQTAKTFFYKELKPSKDVVLDNGTLFINAMNFISFKQYLNIDDLEEEQYKILKSKFNAENVIDESIIQSLLFINKSHYEIDEEVMNNHLFFRNDNFRLLRIAFKLGRFVSSLTSVYIKRQVFELHDNYTIDRYNETLEKFQHFYLEYNDDIINNLEYIKFSLFYENGNGSDFEERLNELLEKEPIV